MVSPILVIIGCDTYIDIILSYLINFIIKFKFVFENISKPHPSCFSRSLIYSNQFYISLKSSYRIDTKARFHIKDVTQINKSVVYFTVRRNVKFSCSKCQSMNFDVKSGLSTLQYKNIQVHTTDVFSDHNIVWHEAESCGQTRQEAIYHAQVSAGSKRLQTVSGEPNLTI